MWKGGSSDKRAIKDKAQQENLKSAITDHCKRENHIMDWDNARVIKQEGKRPIPPLDKGGDWNKKAEPEGDALHTWSSVLGGGGLAAGGVVHPSKNSQVDHISVNVSW